MLHISMLKCFPYKTGTLTEEGLDLRVVIPVNSTTNLFDEPSNSAKACSKEMLKIGMASCHSLTQIAGEVVGDPLDIKVFIIEAIHFVSRQV
jgi:magnesium-transporting ATPase (P-type)